IGLIGPNGAGKTTLFNCIMGRYKVTAGTIRFEGHEITNKRPFDICKMGISATHQIVRPFNKMTVYDNLMVAAIYGRAGKSSKDVKASVDSILDFTELSQYKHKMAKDLTLVLKRRLEIARSLATNPKLLLLDESLAGLNPAETAEAVELIFKLRDKMGTTIFWIEHVMGAIMNAAEYMYVLNYGEKIAEGTPSEVASDVSVIEAYLGRPYGG
ncbi:MAG TPA: ABC transporter ATP-binding protein, partial [Chromatiaceae bacterium]|nr:ABC transporter ATP-binding protein [Chromatiaceae bacterium]